MLQTFYSIVSSHANEEDTNFAQHLAKYLQSLNCSGLPPSWLILKVGSLVMLLRKLYPSERLCNSTRMIVTWLGFQCIEGQILGGNFYSTKKLIPQILPATTEGELPFILRRKQFSIKLCFTMTVNKSQGQTSIIVGLNLYTSAFTHDQFYVAMSRVIDVTKLAVLLTSISPVTTQNIVYPELLLSVTNGCSLVSFLVLCVLFY